MQEAPIRAVAPPRRKAGSRPQGLCSCWEQSSEGTGSTGLPFSANTHPPLSLHIKGPGTRGQAGRWQLLSLTVCFPNFSASALRLKKEKRKEIESNEDHHLDSQSLRTGGHGKAGRQLQSYSHGGVHSEYLTLLPPLAHIVSGCRPSARASCPCVHRSPMWYCSSHAWFGCACGQNGIALGARAQPYSSLFLQENIPYGDLKKGQVNSWILVFCLFSAHLLLEPGTLRGLGKTGRPTHMLYTVPACLKGDTLTSQQSDKCCYRGREGDRREMQACSQA